ncbi:MAG: tRNA 2-selenouridine(34) synthase MnmH, partial [Eubacteriaceae bacterium]|nr:tRNA 2-selenouridine(34) synthase MnmH [Eubacteriaceae bacterium]
MIIEDESRNIGRSYIPRELFEFLKKGQIVVLEVPLEERTRLTADEYVSESQAKYIQVFGETQGIQAWHDAISGSIHKVKKRLGGELHQRTAEIFEKAYRHQMDTGELMAHDAWVELLLKEYYDPMYGFQIEQKNDQIVFKGNWDEVLAFLKSLN